MCGCCIKEEDSRNNREYSLYDPGNDLGNPYEMSVMELAKLVQELSGKEVGIKMLPLPTDDPKVRQPDISRARETLGWEPQVSLREGLARTIEYFKTTP